MKEVRLHADHLGMSVSDLEDSVEWFDRVLGFKLERRAEMAGCHIAFVQNGDFMIELFQHPEARPAAPERSVPDEDIKTLGNKHMCFRVPDLDGLLEHFAANQVRVVLGPLTTPDGYKVAFIHGPDKALIELIQRL
jgi:methylmalonyl-CoA/ethylmalonyl-CoA epimerase